MTAGVGWGGVLVPGVVGSAVLLAAGGGDGRDVGGVRSLPHLLHLHLNMVHRPRSTYYGTAVPASYMYNY